MGPINGTGSLKPARNAEFSKELARTISLVPVSVPFGPPDFFLKAVLGEVADVVTKGQKVLPARAEVLGYRFQFPDLRSALDDLFPQEEAASRRPRRRSRPARGGVSRHRVGLELRRVGAERSEGRTSSGDVVSKRWAFATRSAPPYKGRQEAVFPTEVGPIRQRATLR